MNRLQELLDLGYVITFSKIEGSVFVAMTCFRPRRRSVNTEGPTLEDALELAEIKLRSQW